MLTRTHLKVTYLDKLIERTLLDQPLEQGMAPPEHKVHFFGEGQALSSKNYSILYKTFLTSNENDKNDLELLLQSMQTE